LKDKSIGRIKWQKASLENLLGIPSIKRRMRRSTIWDYQIGEHQNPPFPFNVAPTNGKKQNYPWADPCSFMRLLGSNPGLANADCRQSERQSGICGIARTPGQR
jgi:hypothetical protein